MPPIVARPRRCADLGSFWNCLSCRISTFHSWSHRWSEMQTWCVPSATLTQISNLCKPISSATAYDMLQVTSPLEISFAKYNNDRLWPWKSTIHRHECQIEGNVVRTWLYSEINLPYWSGIKFLAYTAIRDQRFDLTFSGTKDFLSRQHRFLKVL